METCLVCVYSWEMPRLCICGMELAVGDKVIVREQQCLELATVVRCKEGGVLDADEDNQCVVVRKATEQDLKDAEGNEEKRKEAMRICREEVDRLKLAMKLVDVRMSLDGSSMAVMFTADERVDFRELVKSIAQIFRRSVRMHQIGSRDEARRLMGCGACGRDLCCKRLKGGIPSISIEMARVQQIAHRGSERISGVCGRLMCCLAHETGQYQQMLKGLPQPHSAVRTAQGKGEVLEVNALTGQVRVRLTDGAIVTYSHDQLK
ncbi:MAG TPA: regulatory iron-sulfur-containing complex subunit RicT [Candidatus Moranbacteria bacterium]|nr:regulatory iron-sulfur-containing complex subunit RicT [Candidatus Moranbacteria bacterium]